MNKDEAVKDLIEYHFDSESELRTVFRFISEREDDPDEPVKLLEVSGATPATGSVDVFGFRSTETFPFRLMIAEVTPEEMDAIRADPSRLPAGWRLDSAVEISRNRL